jgi:hypothetical protein
MDELGDPGRLGRDVIEFQDDRISMLAIGATAGGER